MTKDIVFKEIGFTRLADLAWELSRHVEWYRVVKFMEKWLLEEVDSIKLSSAQEYDDQDYFDVLEGFQCFDKAGVNVEYPIALYDTLKTRFDIAETIDKQSSWVGSPDDPTDDDLYGIALDELRDIVNVTTRPAEFNKNQPPDIDDDWKDLKIYIKKEVDSY